MYAFYLRFWIFSCVPYLTLQDLNSGIYYRNEGIMLSSHKFWNVRFFLDFSSLDMMSDSISTYIWYINETLLHQNNSKTFGILYNDLVLLKRRYNDSEMIIRNLRLFFMHPKRSKRSWFPFIGKMLSSMAGLATEDDTNSIKESVRQLYTHDKEILHILEGHLTVINTTRLDLVKNTARITELTNSVERIILQLSDVNANVRTLNSALHSLQVSTYLNSLFIIVNNYLDMYIETIHKFVGQIEVAMAGVMPYDLIDLNEVYNVLTNIHSRLPDGLSLPYDIDVSLLKYFSQFKVTLFLHRDYTAITLRIPIVSPMIFTFYSVYSVWVPDMASTYSFRVHKDLDNAFYAFSRDRHLYFHFDPTFLNSCLHHSDHTILCQIDKPLQVFMSTPDCFSSVFFHVKNFSDYCQADIMHYDTPIATQLTSFEWIISTKEVLVGHLFCPEKTETVQLNPPLQLITLTYQCRFLTSYFVLYSMGRNDSSSVPANTVLQHLPFISLENVSLFQTLRFSNHLSLNLSLQSAVDRLSPVMTNLRDRTDTLLRSNNKIVDQFDGHRTLSHAFDGTLISIFIILVVSVFIFLIIHRTVLIRFTKYLQRHFSREVSTGANGSQISRSPSLVVHYDRTNDHSEHINEYAHLNIIPQNRNVYGNPDRLMQVFTPVTGADGTSVVQNV